MKRIAILNCLKSNRVCTGAGCLKAFNNHTGAFEQYGEEPLVLEAFFHCNGCDAPEEDAGMEEKVQRILALKPDAVHMGVCTRKKPDRIRCATIQKIADRFASAGITLVDGTH